MKAAKVIAVASGVVCALAIGFAVVALRDRRDTAQAREQWLAKETALQTALGRAQASLAESTKKTADLAADQRRLAADRQAARAKAAAQQGPPDWSLILAQHPEFQAAFEKAFAARQAHLYGSLYRKLQLSQDQIDRLDEAMAKDIENTMDLTGTARAQGLAQNDPSIVQLRQQQAADLQTEEQQILGPANYPAFQTYDNEAPVRNAVGDAASMAIASGTPFTQEQEERVTEILAQTSAPFQQNPGQRINPSSVNWDAALAQAQSFLSPGQLAALQAEAQFAPLGQLQKQFYAQRPAVSP